MWPILVEFRSASLEIRQQKKKKERKKKESVVKYKSADNYVGRPNLTLMLIVTIVDIFVKLQCILCIIHLYIVLF